MSIEQLTRDVLEKAITDGLVRLADSRAWGDPHPQARSAGQLAGAAGMIADYIAQRDGVRT